MIIRIAAEARYLTEKDWKNIMCNMDGGCRKWAAVFLNSKQMMDFEDKFHWGYKVRKGRGRASAGGLLRIKPEIFATL